MKKSIFFIVAAAMVLMTPCAQARILGKKAKPKANVELPAVKEEPSIDITPILEGEWTIKSVGITDIVREENVPYITFVNADNAFYANNGCNVLNGVFTIENGDKITFHNVLSTMKYCPDTPFDTQINEVLADANTVKVDVDRLGGETYLYLNNSLGHRVMTLRRHSLSFLNGNWRVTEINGEKFDDDEMTIFFDIAEKKIHGNTGCNFFNGDIYIDPVVPNAINFSAMGVTRRACPKGDQERKLLVALEETTVGLDGKDGKALLTDTRGQSVVKLVKISDTIQEDGEITDDAE